MKTKKHAGFPFMVLFLTFLFILPVLAIPGSRLPSAGPDLCSVPDMAITVVIDACDSGVSNVADAEGCTISDKIMKCALDARNHGAFVSCTAGLTNRLKKDGVISGKEKGQIQRCAARADIPYEDNVVVSGLSPGFQFETETDPLSVALRTVYEAYNTTPTPENMVEMDALRNAGAAYLRQHPTEAALALISEASHLDPSDRQGFMTVFHLLGYVDSEASVEFLFDHVRRDLPQDCFDEEEGCMDARILRLSALGSLARISSSGSSMARQKVLSLVPSEDASLQERAIGLYYDTSGMSRWRAKREMQKRLPASQRYLVHQIY